MIVRVGDVQTPWSGRRRREILLDARREIDDPSSESKCKCVLATRSTMMTFLLSVILLDTTPYTNS
jgi:hypothetical protein